MDVSTRRGLRPVRHGRRRGPGSAATCAWWTTSCCWPPSSHHRVIPAFCLGHRLLHGRHASGPRTQFLLERLRDLDGALRERGSGLAVRRGAPERELPALAARGRGDAGALHGRGRAVRAPARRAGRRDEVELVAHPGLNAVDDIEDLRTQQGRPYAVFSPFHRTWRDVPRRAVLQAPRELLPLPRAGQGPGAVARRAGSAAGGRRAAAGRRARGARAAEALPGRRRAHVRRGPRPARRRPLVAALAVPAPRGCVSAREVEERLPAGEGPEAFRRQLGWRDFYCHVLAHHPANARAEFQERYRGMRWSRAASASRRGATAAPASRSSTPGCASSCARAGCTTARAWSSARS